MTLNVKHYSNSGGACSNRDSKGAAEKMNIGILTSKWPRAFRPNPKRRNEVIMSWPADDDAEGVKQESKSMKSSNPKSASVKKLNMKKSQSAMKKDKKKAWSPTSVLASTDKVPTQPYIAARCKKAHGMKVEKALASLKFKDISGAQRKYRCSDLKYDLFRGFLKLKAGKKAA